VAFIPIRVEFEGNKHGYVYMANKQAKQSTTQKLPAKPRNVVFAPDSSLLAVVKRN
jgi:hypothetical protein